MIDRYIPLLESIAAMLLAKVTTSFVTNLSGTISKRLKCRNTSRAEAGMISQYLTLYPLLSSKHLNFLCWRQVYCMLMVGSTKTTAGYNKVKKLKETHNSRRSDLDWTHLKDTYKQ